jgi:hypothetical protein
MNEIMRMMSTIVDGSLPKCIWKLGGGVAANGNA